MERKYELVKEDSINCGWYRLYRIKALRDFSDVKKGDIGGYIEKEDNLSHEGNCWIFDNAKVFGNTRVYGNAMVYNAAKVYDNASVFGNAKVSGNAMVYNAAKVYDNASVFGNAKVFGVAMVFGDAKVYGHARVYDDAKVFGYAIIHGDTILSGGARISNDAIISSKDDYLVIKGLGSYNRDTTFFKCKDNNIKVNCGCFNGTLDEFIDKVNDIHKDNDKYREEYLLQVEVIKRHFNIKNESDDIITKSPLTAVNPPMFNIQNKVRVTDDYTIFIEHNVMKPNHWIVTLLSHLPVKHLSPLHIPRIHGSTIGGDLVQHIVFAQDIEANDQDHAEQQAMDIINVYLSENKLSPIV